MSPDASLYSVKVLGANGSGNYSDLIAGIDWAIESQLDIMNISLGGTSDSKALKRVWTRLTSQGY